MLNNFLLVNKESLLGYFWHDAGGSVKELDARHCSGTSIQCIALGLFK